MSAIDSARRAAKINRAAGRGGDLFLYCRAFAEVADRLADLPAAARLLIVHPDALGWTAGANVTTIAGERVALGRLEPAMADLIVAVGVIERSDDPALAAFILASALKPGGRLIGASLGGRSLERLRGALIEAERGSARVGQRFHPPIDGPALAAVLGSAGLGEAVIDVDSVTVRYRGLGRLVGDLRDMGCTASLAGTPLPLTRKIIARARLNFLGGFERASETFEILHFSATLRNAVTAALTG